jgi:acyl carrier protein
MTAEDILHTVKAQTGVEVVALETTLEDMGLDSLDFLELMLACGVPREAELGIHTVGDIVKAVCV